MLKSGETSGNSFSIVKLYMSIILLLHCFILVFHIGN